MTALRPRHDLENSNVRSERERFLSTREVDLYIQKQQDLDDIYKANVFPLHGFGNEDRPSGSKRSQAPSQKDASSPNAGSSITLIRRYNGIQSNVARIEGEDSLQVLTPSYLKYCDQDNATSQQIVQDCKDSERIAIPFRRILRPRTQMKRPRRGDRSGSIESFLDFPLTRHTSEDRRHSHQDTIRFTNDGAVEEHSSLKSFFFHDPWHAECEFIAGIAGRSLRCRRASKHTSLANVSELRFNLPSSQALRSPLPTLLGSSKESRRSSFFGRLQRASSSASQRTTQVKDTGSVRGDDSESRLDLSLGQEHAGGGFGGKQAKLGKLIIEPEGVPMLDLLVAANMAMWWKIYEKFQ